MLDKFLIEDTIKNALKEDMSNGDITTDLLIDDVLNGKAVVIAKEEGIVCGISVFETVFEIVDKSVECVSYKSDGERVIKGEEILRVRGNIKSILKAERLALNFLQRMSGIASKTQKFVRLVEDLGVRIVDTRKTTPGLRIFEKYAVLRGGAFNHRFNLSDAVMIKDNHIEAVGGIKEAVRLIKEKVSHTTKIEVEVKDLQELREALDAQVDIIMLDNMSECDMKEAVGITDKRAILEASGNITSDNLRSVAETGVDVISIGALTHSFNSLDLSLNIILGGI